MNKNHNSVWVLEDSYYGKKGRGVWVVPLGSIAVMYQMSLIVDVLSNKNNGIVGVVDVILILAFLALSVLFVLSVVFIKQGIKTAQMFEIDERAGYCSVTFYFGRRYRFNKESVKNITPYKIRLLHKFVLPLGRGRRNYKFCLSDGEKFYVNSSMSGMAEVLDMFFKPIAESKTASKTA